MDRLIGPLDRLRRRNHLAHNGPGELLVEQKYALKSDLTPAEWRFGHNDGFRVTVTVIEYPRGITALNARYASRRA